MSKTKAWIYTITMTAILTIFFWPAAIISIALGATLILTDKGNSQQEYINLKIKKEAIVSMLEQDENTPRQ